MTADTKVHISGLDERAATTNEMQAIDFSHPDIVRARSAVYALLLHWAKERKEKEAKERATAADQAAGVDTFEQTCENTDSEYTDGNQIPTPADTEVGER